MRLAAKSLDTSTGLAHRVGNADLAVASVGEVTITREVMHPGWRWSVDVRPLVGTHLCLAHHEFFVTSGRLHVVTDDGAEIDLAAGDAGIIPPGHDAWVVGDEPCEMIDFSPAYSRLVEAGHAYRALTGAAGGSACSPAEAAKELRAEAQRGRLDLHAVETILDAIGQRPPRGRGPAGLTRREVQVLVLIATGASAKQVGYALGIAPRTAATHIERIYMKCGVSSRADATRFAIAHGLVEPALSRRPRVDHLPAR